MSPAKHVLENDHNAYILGAGYSVDAGLPLMWNFLEKMRDASKDLDPTEYSREIKAMESVFKIRLDRGIATGSQGTRRP